MSLRTRRRAIALALPALVVTGCASASGGDGSDSSGPVTFVSWGGSYQEGQSRAWIEPYEKETGRQIIQDGPTDYSKLRTMVEAGQVTWDVVVVESDFGLEVDAEWLEPIDYSVVEQESILDGMADKYRVGILLYSVVLGYNTAALGSDVPQGWPDFFDTKRFPCKRAAQKRASSGILEVALMADGVPPSAVYPIDVDRALRGLDAVKDDIVWFDTGSEAQQLLASGEVCMAAIYNGRVYSAETDDGAPVDLVWDQHVFTADYLVVPKGAPHLDAAMELVAYITSPEPQGRLSRYLPYAPANTDASPDPDIAPNLPTSHLESSLRFDDAWWAENFAAVDERFQSWLLE